MKERKQRLVEVIKGSLYRSEDNGLRISKMGSYWYVTMAQMLSEERESFTSKKAALEFLHRHNWNVTI